MDYEFQLSPYDGSSLVPQVSCALEKRTESISREKYPKMWKITDHFNSKKVSEKKREKLYDIILEEAVSYGIGIVYQDEIDKINILQATKKGLTEAVEQMKIKPNLIMVDALTGIDTLGIPYKSIIKGDAKCYSISAASIIAKVTRDRIMREWDKIYPQYGFESHKGYGTAKHIAALKEYGPCEIHRRSFIKHFVK